ncbi:hypothetical protein BJX65DRAFT_313670 [Aspergillus insuetus]
MAPNPRRDEYHAGIICALAMEHAAVVGMLDEEYLGLRKPPGDNNSYTFGRIGGNNVVVACLPAGVTGTVSAAHVARDMRRTFPDMNVGLMVGIGGGVWSLQRDIRLGDVVVSQPEGIHGGVVQWDFGKTGAGGRFERTGQLNKPPAVLLQALQAAKSRHLTDGIDLGKCLGFMASAKPRLGDKCRYPGAHRDNLFQASYTHSGVGTCEGCSPASLVQRPPRAFNSPTIHYGNIASGNQVIKDGVVRDHIAQSENIICFEMEAAGLMDNFPCLVIRGICDYADSHKNDDWEPYAAATAAAFARILLLEFIKPRDIESSKHDGLVHWYVPFYRNRMFVGRQEQLSGIERRQLDHASKLAIFGLGGIGKTQIALELAYRIKGSHPDCSVFWISAANTESFRQEYKDICGRLGLDDEGARNSDSMAVLHKYLSSEKSGEWLMILDNADDYDLLFNGSQEPCLLDYVPQSSNGWVVMTTRDKRVAARFAGRENSIEVMHMDEETAAQMLGNIIGEDDVKANKSNTSVLLNRLCCLPLAIVQAGSYMNMNHDTVNIAEYLSFLDEADLGVVELLGEDFDGDARYRHQQNPVTNTWLISFDRIRQQQPLAAEYLAYMCFFDPKRIPESLLPPTRMKKDQQAAIQCLINYSFITTAQRHGNYDMHRLVHLTMRNWLRKNGTYNDSAENAVEKLADVFEDIPSVNREVWRPYLAHVKHALLLHTDLEATNAVKLQSLYGVRLTIEGRYQESEEWLRKVLDIRSRVLGESHNLTITSRDLLCNPLLEQGRYSEVEDIFREIVRVTIKAYGLEHKNTFAAINLIGWILCTQRHWEDAENLYASLIPVQERQLGRAHQDTIKSKRNLCVNLCEQRKWKEAEDALRDLLATKSDDDLDRDHDNACCPGVYRDKENLVDVLVAQKRIQDAEALQREVIESKAKTEGLERCTLGSKSRLVSLLWDHGRKKDAVNLQAELLRDRERLLNSTASTAESMDIPTMHKIAQRLLDDGQWQDAQAQFERLADACLGAGGEENSQTLYYRVQVAWVLYQKNQYVEAEELLLRVLERTTQLLGDTHPDTLLCKSRLVKTYLKQQKFDLAHNLQYQVLDAKLARLGEGNYSTLEEMGQLADICEMRGATDEAVRLQKAQTEATQKEMGTNHPDTLKNMEALALIYHKNNRFKDAQEIEEELVLLMRTTRGHDHPDTVALTDRVVSRFHYHELRRKEEELLIEAHETSMNANGPTHPKTLAIMNSLASLYHDRGECDKSEIYLSRVYEATRQAKGKNHPDTLSSMARLASTYGCISKPEIAEPLLNDLIARQRKVLGPANEHTLNSIRFLAKNLEGQNRITEAEEQWRQLIEAGRVSDDEDTTVFIFAMSKLAWICYEQQRFKEAENLWAEILEREKSSHGLTHPKTLVAMDQLAVMIWNQKRFGEAAGILTPLVETCKTALPPGDQQTLRSATNLGVTLFDAGRLEEAEAHFDFVLQIGEGNDKAEEYLQRSMAFLLKIKQSTGRLSGALYLEERLKWLNDSESENAVDSDGGEIVEDPMEIDADVAVTISKTIAHTPLQWAILCKKLDAVKLLVERRTFPEDDCKISLAICNALDMTKIADALRGLRPIS